MKDGGVFIRFRYIPKLAPGTESTQALRTTLAMADPALAEIERTLTDKIAVKGGLPLWFGISYGHLWKVYGTPWLEDMRRYASSILRVSFEGPDVRDEQLWKTLRV